MTESAQRRLLDTLNEFNAEHQVPRADNSNLAARIASYELAFKMQTSVPGLMDLSQEPKRILEM